MKLKLSSCLFVVLMGAIVAGCGDSAGPSTVTEGASADAIAEYEAAVLAAEQSDLDAGMEAEAEAFEEPAAVEEPASE